MIPEFPNFKKIELSDKEEVEKFTSKYPPYSDFNFVSIWSWDVVEEMKVSQLNGNLVVRFIDYITNEPFYSFLGSNKVNETAEALFELSKKEGIPVELKLIPEDSVQGLDNQKFKVIESQDNFDYVYDVTNLYKCAGGEYVAQRLYINRFNKKYTSIEVKLLPIGSIQKDILELSERWRLERIGRDDELELKKEAESIKRIFDFTDKNLIVVSIFHDNKLIAYAIDEVLNNGYSVCHFLKADVSFVGAYAFLMQQSSRILSEDFGVKSLNLEQDLGIPSLRFSKNKFRPALFLKKYTVSLIDLT